MDYSSESFKQAINDSQSTREKRQLKRERDAFLRELEKPEIPTAAPQDNSPKDPFYDPQGSSGNAQGDGQAPTTESTSSTLYDTSNSDEAAAGAPTNDSAASGGLPDGYVETAVTICANGSPVSGQFLFKQDTP